MDISPNARHRINHSWWLLKLTYGLLFIVAGADKYMNIVTNWDKYVSPMALQFLPAALIQAVHFIMLVGIIEVVIGITTLFVNTRVGAYATMVWLLIIVVNLLSMGMYFDIAVRDVVMAIGAFVLAQLTSVHNETRS